jgi:hypothetical protein
MAESPEKVKHSLRIIRKSKTSCLKRICDLTAFAKKLDGLETREMGRSLLLKKLKQELFSLDDEN